MPKLRVLTAFVLIAISLLAFGVDLIAEDTDSLVKSGFEGP